MSLRFPYRLILVILGLFLLSFDAMAQAAGAAQTRPSNENGVVEQIINSAQNQGLPIIVIDAGNGATLTQDDSSSNGAASFDLDNFELFSLMELQSNAIKFRDILKQKLRALPDSLDQAIQNLRELSPTGQLRPYAGVLYWSLVLLFAGMLFEHYVYSSLIIGRRLDKRIKANPVGYRDKLPLLLLLAIKRLVGVVISMVVAYTIGSIMFRGTPPETIQFTIAIIYAGYAIIRVVGIIWRSILAPYLCQYRIPHFSDKDSRRLFLWLWFTSGFNICAIMCGIWVGALAKNGIVDAFLTATFGGVVAVLNTLMVIANRKAISRAIRNGKSVNMASGSLRFLSIVWFPIAVFYFIFSWLHMIWLLVLEKGLTTPLIAGAYAILIAVLLVYALINYIIDRFFYRQQTIALLNAASSTTEEATSETPEANVAETLPDNIRPPYTLRTYEDLARRIAGILALIAGFWSLTRIWNIGQVMQYDALLEQSLDVMVILFFGYVIYHAVRIWIDNKIVEEGGEDTPLAPGDEGGASSASRLATLLPLFRNFMLVVVAVSVIFSAFMEIGVNLSPLFASAGVVGLAIGFGAQTLVRDIFSGAFYLFDDAFRKGEYVDIGSVKGTVEKISVRSFQLRHHLGPLHTIPFGEIQVLTNYSRDWVMMKLPLRLTYDTDVEKVRKLIKKLGLQLLEDPEIGHTFLQPLKSQGVLEMQDSAMIVRVKFMAKPGDQWVIRKRVYQEIRDLFEREGIRFAHREVTVRIATEAAENLTDVQKQALAAATLDDDPDDGANDSGGDDR
ncbi:MAG: mechanosensitive ion channel [Granulosicoccus sp.]|nr:mechanosensitive ion channel [Granulosicoccus sp.]